MQDAAKRRVQPGRRRTPLENGQQRLARRLVGRRRSRRLSEQLPTHRLAISYFFENTLSKNKGNLVLDIPTFYRPSLPARYAQLFALSLTHRTSSPIRAIRLMIPGPLPHRRFNPFAFSPLFLNYAPPFSLVHSQSPSLISLLTTPLFLRPSLHFFPSFSFFDSHTKSPLVYLSSHSRSTLSLCNKTFAVGIKKNSLYISPLVSPSTKMTSLLRLSLHQRHCILKRKDLAFSGVNSCDLDEIYVPVLFRRLTKAGRKSSTMKLFHSKSESFITVLQTQDIPNLPLYHLYIDLQFGGIPVFSPCLVEREPGG